MITVLGASVRCHCSGTSNSVGHSDAADRATPERTCVSLITMSDWRAVSTWEYTTPVVGSNQTRPSVALASREPPFGVGSRAVG